MPEFFESIPDHLIPWLLDQELFFVSSAPLSKDGHINLSPKGLKGSFRVNNANEVWYEDLMGSGMSLISMGGLIGKMLITEHKALKPFRMSAKMAG